MTQKHTTPAGITARTGHSSGGLLRPGMMLAPRTLTAVQDRGSATTAAVPDPQRLVHLQFRRYAGCPICSLHLRGFAVRHAELTARGIEEIAVFHSSEADLAPLVEELPFAVVPDPQRLLYREFGVERSWKTLLPPSVWWAAARGWWRRRRTGPQVTPAPPQRETDGDGGGDSGHLGLPADFLIDPHGAILACYYGKHANDQWSVDEVLALAVAYEPGD